MFKVGDKLKCVSSIDTYEYDWKNLLRIGNVYKIEKIDYENNNFIWLKDCSVVWLSHEINKMFKPYNYRKEKIMRILNGI